MGDNPLLIRSDLLLNKRNNFSTALRNNSYSSNGRSQRLKLKLRKRSQATFYLWVQNDGLSARSFKLQVTPPKKKIYKFKAIRITGGGANITGSIRRGVETGELAIDEQWLCRCQVRGKKRRGRHTLRFSAFATTDPSVRDVGQVQILAKDK